MVIKGKLERYKKMALFAKSIELITLTALTLLKDLFLQSKNSSSLLSTFLFQFKSNSFIDNSLIIPYFTDKSCSGIMNSRLVTYLDKIKKVLNYKNIASCIFGTGMNFQKK